MSSRGKCVLRSESSKTEDRGELRAPICGSVFDGRLLSSWAKPGNIGRGEPHAERSSRMDERDEADAIVENEEESAEGGSGLLGREREPSTRHRWLNTWDTA
jgi:hypothetical protein